MSHAITLVSFVSAELSKDRGQMHAIRLTVVRAAIDAALRGNKTQCLQAAAMVATAKGQLAKAYRAGFDAVPAPEKFPYAGKLSAADAAAIAAKAEELTEKFSAAFVEVFPLTSAELTEEEKAKKEAAKKEKADKAAIARAQELGYVPAPKELGVSELTDKVCELIASGQLSGENLELISKAIQAAKEAAKVTARASKAKKETAAA